MHLSARTPRDFNGVLHYKMLYDRNPLLPVFADKLSMRAFVVERLGESYLPRLIHVTQSASEMAKSLPQSEFVVKLSNGSGSVLICTRLISALDSTGLDCNPRSVCLAPPDHVSKDGLERLFGAWMELPNYAWYPGRRVVEWAYSATISHLLAEELLVTEQKQLVQDLKFFTFSGRVRFINFISRHSTPHAGVQRQTLADLLSPNWERLGVTKEDWAPHPDLPERPRNLENMIKAAEELSRGTDFLRVDMYDLGSRIIVGELTNYPMAGKNTFRPASFSTVIRQMWCPTYGPLAEATMHRSALRHHE